VFQSTLDELFVAQQHYINLGCVIVCGDMNVQLRSDGNALTLREKCFSSFLQSINYISVVNDTKCNGPPYTYLPTATSEGTKIDHICIDNALYDVTSSCNIIDDDALNTSDHLPVTLNMTYSIERYDMHVRSVTNWDDSTYYDDYAKFLETLLPDTPTLQSSADEQCQLITTSIHRASAIIPTKPFHKHVKPYWDNDVKEAHTKQLTNSAG